MNYELAKELKDAGYPLTKSTWRFNVGNDESGYEHLPNPTLSELIEACGEGEFCLSYFHSKKVGWIWQADRNPFMDVSAPEQRKGNGATAEEAVARLYLALHHDKNR